MARDRHNPAFGMPRASKPANISRNPGLRQIGWLLVAAGGLAPVRRAARWRAGGRPDILEAPWCASAGEMAGAVEGVGNRSEAQVLGSAGLNQRECLLLEVGDLFR